MEASVSPSATARAAQATTSRSLERAIASGLGSSPTGRTPVGDYAIALAKALGVVVLFALGGVAFVAFLVWGCQGGLCN